MCVRKCTPHTHTYIQYIILHTHSLARDHIKYSITRCMAVHRFFHSFFTSRHLNVSRAVLLKRASRRRLQQPEPSDGGGDGGIENCMTTNDSLPQFSIYFNFNSLRHHPQYTIVSETHLDTQSYVCLCSNPRGE